MVLVGLTGGIASGKSLVAQLFKKNGAHLIDADVLAREVVAPGRPALIRIREVFGPGILLPDQTLNRAKMAQIIFDDPENRQILNAIVHPFIFAEEERLRKEIASRDPHAIVVFDAALLIESGAHELMDRVVLVTVDRPTQIRRIMSRDGLSREAAVKRIAAQLPAARKKKKADYLIDGGLSAEAIEHRVKKIFDDLTRIA